MRKNSVLLKEVLMKQWQRARRRRNDNITAETSGNAGNA
jgi:hypothetical protein